MTVLLTTDASVIGDKVLNLLDTNKGLFDVADVWLGDQQLLPRTPAACVVVGNTAVDLAGAPRRVNDTYNLTINVYHTKITDNQEVERQCNQRAEAIRRFLDNYDSGRLDGLVIDSMVTLIEPGFANRGAGTPSWYKTSRINWQGRQRYNLYYNPT
jgi:hypothetical protein